MLQTAQLRGEEHYLKISDRQTLAPSDNIAAPESFLNSELIETSFQKVSPLYYNKRIRFSFLIRDEYRPDFVLIKGLMEFHRPKDLVFAYDLKQKSIGIDINDDQLNHLQVFLSRIFEWVKREKQFRHALKIALEFENRYRLERESVYEILRRTTVAAHTGQQAQFIP